MTDSSQLAKTLFSLVSTSPRRKQLLEELGISFSLLLPEGPEPELDPGDIDNSLLALAEHKVDTCLNQISEETIAIGADTTVVCGLEVMGKPKDRRDAERMLNLMAGRTHEVKTGIYLFSKKLGSRSRVVTTEVTFKDLSAETISQYLDTPEPFDKAGSYAIQGIASRFVESFSGSYTNVVGLPLEAFMEELEDLTGTPIGQWIRK